MKTNAAALIGLFVIFTVGFGCKSLSNMLPKAGTEFVIQIETNEADKQAIVQRAIKITDNKINAMALDGHVKIDTDDQNRMIVRVYGASDLERAKKFLFTSYQMELRKVISPPNPMPLQTYPLEETAKKIATGEQEVLLFTERSDPTDSEQTDSSKKFVIVEKSAIVNGDDIRDAKAFSSYGKRDDYNQYQISFSLKPNAAARFGDWTGRNINNYIAVVLNNKVQSAAFIKSQIFDSGEINGRFTKIQAEDIAMSLKSGYLPATMRIIDEKKIGN